MEMNRTIEDFINAIGQDDYTKAEPAFNDLMSGKIETALDAQKIDVADKIYNGVEAEEPEAVEDEAEEAEDDQRSA